MFRLSVSLLTQISKLSLELNCHTHSPQINVNHQQLQFILMLQPWLAACKPETRWCSLISLWEVLVPSSPCPGLCSPWEPRLSAHRGALALLLGHGRQLGQNAVQLQDVLNQQLNYSFYLTVLQASTKTPLFVWRGCLFPQEWIIWDLCL